MNNDFKHWIQQGQLLTAPDLIHDMIDDARPKLWKQNVKLALISCMVSLMMLFVLTNVSDGFYAYAQDKIYAPLIRLLRVLNPPYEQALLERYYENIELVVALDDDRDIVFHTLVANENELFMMASLRYQDNFIKIDDATWEKIMRTYSYAPQINGNDAVQYRNELMEDRNQFVYVTSYDHSIIEGTEVELVVRRYDETHSIAASQTVLMNSEHLVEQETKTPMVELGEAGRKIRVDFVKVGLVDTTVQLTVLCQACRTDIPLGIYLAKNGEEFAPNRSSQLEATITYTWDVGLLQGAQQYSLNIDYISWLQGDERAETSLDLDTLMFSWMPDELTITAIALDGNILRIETIEHSTITTYPMIVPRILMSSDDYVSSQSVVSPDQLPPYHRSYEMIIDLSAVQNQTLPLSYVGVFKDDLNYVLLLGDE